MKYQDILREINSGKFRPVYFLAGEEPYFIDKIVKLIEQKALPEDQQSFNQTTLYGRDTDMLIVISEAKRFPMMAERVVVVVREAQHIRNIDPLEDYLKNPQPSTVLVIAYKNKKLDKRKKIYKLLGNGNVYLESNKLYDNQIPAWIEENLQHRGYKVTNKAVHLMSESLGTDLGRIDSELQKLELVINTGETIDEDLVEKNIGISKDYNIFELTKAIGAKDFQKAMRIQKYFAANQKDHPLIMILGILYGYFSKIMLLHVVRDKSQGALAAKLKVSPYFVKDYVTAANNYDLKKLARIVSYLRETDTRGKGVNNAYTSEAELLKELLFKIFYV